MALFLAVIITVLRGESANLLSVGAIDLGIIVDATVIMVENIFRHLAHHAPHAIARCATPALTDKLHRILAAAVEVDKPIFFSVIITIAAFLPLFTMQGVEGQIFGPMARTYAYALLGAVIATFTVTPVMSSILLPARGERGRDLPRARHPQGLPGVLPLAVRNAGSRPLIALAFLAGLRRARRAARHRVPAQARRRQHVDPRRCCRRPSRSKPAWTRSRASATSSRAIAPVRTVFSEQGRGEDGTDPDGSFVAEFFVPLKPFERMAEGPDQGGAGQGS